MVNGKDTVHREKFSEKNLTIFTLFQYLLFSNLTINQKEKTLKAILHKNRCPLVADACVVPRKYDTKNQILIQACLLGTIWHP